MMTTKLKNAKTFDTLEEAKAALQDLIARGEVPPDAEILAIPDDVMEAVMEAPERERMS